MSPWLGAGEGPGGDASRAGTRALRVGAQRSLRTRGRAGDEEPARRSGGSTCVSGPGTVRRQPWSLKASRLCACASPFAHPLPVSEGPGQTAGAEYRPLVGKLFVALCETERKRCPRTGLLRSLDEMTVQTLSPALSTSQAPRKHSRCSCLSPSHPHLVSGSPEVILPFHRRRSQSGSGTYEKLPVTQGRLHEDLGCPSFYSHFLMVWNLTHLALLRVYKSSHPVGQQQTFLLYLLPPW